METSNDNDTYTIEITTDGMDTMQDPLTVTIPTLIDTEETGYSLDWDTITISDPDPDLHVEGDIISRKGGEEMNVTQIIHDQTLQIEALSDMIKEMIETKNFDIDWDLERRVEQKKFLNKLSGDRHGNL